MFQGMKVYADRIPAKRLVLLSKRLTALGAQMTTLDKATHVLSLTRNLDLQLITPDWIAESILVIMFDKGRKASTVSYSFRNSFWR
jgi:hypothetical protein